jgi:chitinase
MQNSQAVEIGSYYPSWSAEAKFRLKHLEQSGLASQFTYLNYAFENIYKMSDGTYRCNSGRDIKDHDDGLGMRATLDYLHEFDGAESVDGTTDQATQALAGNFNQIKQLKAHNPNLKVLVAIGGWSWSRWFSAASATPKLRRILVASCVDLYVTGNLPLVHGHGGKRAAAGVFDGFDLDWEHPGLPGIGYNTVSVHDKENFTLLLAEFRKQLSAVTKQNGKRYYLTAAINGAENNMQHTEPASYIQFLDWINLMSYDFHGAWDKNGPADFQSNLYLDPDNPDKHAESIDIDILRYIAAGVPPEKLVMGIPFYARGWTGVGPDNHGLYQPATGPAKTEAGIEPGAESYASIAIKTLTMFYHPVTKQLWTYDDGTFWSYDDPVVIREKIGYARLHKLGGMMSWSLDQDDAQFTLSKAIMELKQPVILLSASHATP